MISLTEENYLESLVQPGEQCRRGERQRIIQQLDIKMPTVTSMMKKLAEKKLVHYESYKPLRLTEKGKKEAALVVRKHRLTEMYLVDKMGFGWEDVHDIAEQVEHVRSAHSLIKLTNCWVFPSTIPMAPRSPIKMENSLGSRTISCPNAMPAISSKFRLSSIPLRNS
jgi:DtxR family Mn-dependent transcriptional regulator